MRRRVVLAAAAWCLVVLVGGTLVWQAIGAAGRDIFDDDAVVSGATPTEAGSTSGPDATTGPTASSGSPSPSPTGAATDAPTTSGTAPTQAPQRQTRSWVGPAGRLVVSCEGQRVGLESASPADGYTMEIDKRGPDEVRVEFERDDGDTRVESRCAAGIPAFEVDESGSGTSG